MSAVSITDGTTYASKAPGQTLTYSFTAVGLAGPYDWRIGELNEDIAVVSGSTPSSGTGGTFTFDGEAVLPGAGQFLVQMVDRPTGQYASIVVDLTVVFPVIPVRIANGNLDDGDSFHLTKVNTTTAGAAVTLALTPDPGGRGGQWWDVKNTGATFNVTVTVPTGKKANDVTNGTFVLTPGTSKRIYSNNYDGYDSV